MTTLSAPVPAVSTLTVADLLEQLGGIPPQRVRLRPAPGTATVADVVSIERTESRLFELVDGTLVEKPMGYKESALAIAIASALREAARSGKPGVVTGESGMIQLFPGLIRMPDVAYVSRQRLPGGKVPTEPAPALVPELAVEVLSESNTSAEMKRKRREYFTVGVRLVWEVSPRTRTVAVYTSEADSRTLTENDTLDAAGVLPEFRLALRELFAELDEASGPA